MRSKRAIITILAIVLGGCLLLIATVIIIEKFVMGTAGEVPLRVLLGQGRIYTDRIPIKLSVDGTYLQKAVAFRNPHAETDVYKIYVSSENNEYPYSVLTFDLDAKMVGFSANTRPNGSLLIADRILLQSDMAVKVVPINFNIKSGMAPSRFIQTDQDSYSFVAQPACNDLKCAKRAIEPGSRWYPLPFGKWNIQLQRD